MKEPIHDLPNTLDLSLGILTVEQQLSQLENSNPSEETITKIEVLRRQNLRLRVRARTYQRCVYQAVITAILFAIGYFVPSLSVSLFVLPIVFVSSMAGIFTNRLRPEETIYLKH